MNIFTEEEIKILQELLKNQAKGKDDHANISSTPEPFVEDQEKYLGMLEKLTNLRCMIITRDFVFSCKGISKGISPVDDVDVEYHRRGETWIIVQEQGDEVTLHDATGFEWFLTKKEVETYFTKV